MFPNAVLGHDRRTFRQAPDGLTETGEPETVKWFAAEAGLTVIPVWLPVIELVTVSVAVIVWLPAVLNVALKVAVPAVRVVVGRQDGLRVGAREVDRAGVAGGGVPERVERGHRERLRRHRRWSRTVPHRECVAFAGVTVMCRWCR